MSGSSTVWLTPSAHTRLARELARLAERDDRLTPAESARRIHLSEILGAALTDTMPDDGIVEPGMVVTVRFARDDSTQTFLLADRTLSGSTEACSPSSPLGAAIIGLSEGDDCVFEGPSGAMIAVRITQVSPYDADGDPLP